jgi:hypothetical protein
VKGLRDPHRIATGGYLDAERAFESAGVEFIDENGGGRGVRLRKRATIRLKDKDQVDTRQIILCVSPKAALLRVSERYRRGHAWTGW